MGEFLRHLCHDAWIALRTNLHVADLADLAVLFNGFRVDTQRDGDQLRAGVLIVILRHGLSRPLYREQRQTIFLWVALVVVDRS